MVESIAYINDQNIIHRDIKPENLIFDSDGYIKLTDFGIAREYKLPNNSETSGTPGYMAPEVLCNLNHSFTADYFAIGVILFEMIIGKRPYIGKSRKEIKEKVLASQAQIKFPHGNYSEDMIDLTNKLLKRKGDERIGSKNGISEIRNHNFFSNIDWQKLRQRKIKPPFIPLLNSDNFDKNFCNADDAAGMDTVERYNIILQDIKYNKYFENFTYIKTIYDVDENEKDTNKVVLRGEDKIELLNKILDPKMNREKYTKIFTKIKPNDVRIKEFSSHLNKVKKISSENTEKTNINDPSNTLKIFKNNHCFKSIRDNRLLQQLNDFNIQEDKSTKLEISKKSVEIESLPQLKLKVKILNKSISSVIEGSKLNMTTGKNNNQTTVTNKYLKSSLNLNAELPPIVK